jgi:hypothetical protein
MLRYIDGGGKAQYICEPDNNNPEILISGIKSEVGNIDILNYYKQMFSLLSAWGCLPAAPD